MKRVSFSAIIVGMLMLGVGMSGAAFGHPPYTFLEAFALAALMMLLSAVGGFEWGLVCLVLQAGITALLRDAWGSAGWLVVVGCVWYVGVTLLAVRGSRVLMGIAAGALFAGLLLERMPTFTLREWVVCVALLLLEVSGMYMAGSMVKGRWFSPYA